jgi:hypothetical protein
METQTTGTEQTTIAATGTAGATGTQGGQQANGTASSTQTNEQTNGAGNAAAVGSEGAQQQTQQTEAVKPYWAEDWRAKLAEHAGAGDKKAIDRELKRLERFNDPQSIYGAFRAMENTWATKGFIKKLGENPSDEDLSTFRKEMGIPEKPEEYLADVKLENGAVLGDADKPLATAFAEVMHKAGIPKEGYNAALNWYFKNQEDAAAQLDEADESFKAEANQALKEEWGPRFKRMINGVSTLFDIAPGGADPNNEQALFSRLLGGRTADGKMIGNDPDVMRWLAGLANERNPMMSVVEDAGAGGVAAGETRLRDLKALRQTDPKRYWSKEVQDEELRLIGAIQKSKNRP